MSAFLTTLFEQAKAVLGQREDFDPTIFGDPLAMTIDWTPLIVGGNNVVTHRFHQETPFQAQFKMAFGGRFFVFIFLLPGIACGALSLYIIIEKIKTIDPIFLAACLLFFIAFTSVGLLMLKKYHTPIIFDTGIGMFWKGTSPFQSIAQEENHKSYVSLKEIHALQLVGEWCYGGKTAYNSYELNLILKDGSRMNIIDHKGLHSMRKDAQKLGIFLGVPVRDNSTK